MNQLTLDNQAIAQIEFENYLEEQAQAIALTCSICKYFAKSANIKTIGYCQHHEQQVRGCDQGCSFANL